MAGTHADAADSGACGHPSGSPVAHWHGAPKKCLDAMPRKRGFGDLFWVDPQEEEGVWELREEEEALENEMLGEQGGGEEGGSEGTEGGGEAVEQGRRRVGGERRRGMKRPGEGDGWELREEEAFKAMKRGEGTDYPMLRSLQ